MGAPTSLTAQQVADLVLANRAIRAPYYDAVHDEGVQYSDLDRGLQWGADAIPALLGLFRVEQDPRSGHPDGWVGFARHWRGGTIRLNFDLFTAHAETAPILVVTAIAGREGTEHVEDSDFGTIELPDEQPSEEEWTRRNKQYQAARRKDEADGSAAVQAYIAALPGWKREVAAQFDGIVESEVPGVHRAVRYHQPFYGLEDRGWFASFSALSKHVKLTFVSGSALEPTPPEGTGPERQSLDLREGDPMENAQVASWIRQAAEDPGMNW